MKAFSLSQEQYDAATSNRSHLLIVSSPGCGKTEVLAHRAGHLSGSLEKNQRVLALTFTNRARSNLEDRLRAVVGQVRLRRQVMVRNFHGFATEIVLAHGRTIGLEVESVQLPKTSTLRKTMTEIDADSSVMYQAENLLKEIKRYPRSDSEVLDAIRQRPPSPTRELAEKVEGFRQDTNQLHYEDLLRHAQRLLRVPAVARLYRSHFGAVLVDEFQDLSLQQLEIAQLSCASQQTFAGDPLQGIYSWAGAAPVDVEAEILKTCGQAVRLHESYRSSPKVLEAVNSVSEQIDPASRLLSAQPEQWAGEGCSAALIFNDRNQEAQELHDLATGILHHHPEASIGIICRAAWRQEEINQVFGEEKDFPVRRWELAIEDPRIAELIQSIVARLPRNINLEDARSAVLETVDAADVDTREQVDEAFYTLEQSGAPTAKAALRTIRLSDPDQTIGPGVHLLNAHTGKGQQFDWVFVVGLEEGHLPGKRNSSGEALKEEQRVLLVMLSRARHGVVVTRVRLTSGRYGPYSATPTRWWSTVRTAFSTVEEIEIHETVGNAITNV